MLYSYIGPIGIETTMVPIGNAQVGCTVTLATGVAGGPSAGVTTRLVGNEMQLGSMVLLTVTL